MRCSVLLGRSRHRVPLFCLAGLLLMAACSGQTDSNGDETSESESSGSTVESEAPEIDDEIAALLEEVGSEVQSWGVSPHSWECMRSGLIEGGYTEGLEDVSLIESIFFDETAPLVDAPPEIEHFMDGFFIFLADPQRGCISPSEMTTVLEHLSANPIDYGRSTYGSDPVLDMLYDGCEAGSMADCDMLYLPSDFGSEYEAFALTCGGRVEPIDPSNLCMVAMDDFSEEPALVDQCQSGFYLACDLLFSITPVGSPEEDIAASCGGLREPDLTTPCWLKYGLGSR